MDAIYKSRHNSEYKVKILQFGTDGYAVIMYENGGLNYVPVTSLYIKEQTNEE